ncbi:fibrocystin isoform X3 [Ornithorhynchus anatinus]|uniref:fibrocystin isoform X3 n=1 Tax=Ornithorhynchus anatinus TaxID=9258 RepID=UPI0010A801AE|nr:fibrocystin isoform X3 [Ornithorhynchus anatinus]
MRRYHFRGKMKAWLVSVVNLEVIFLTVPYASLHIEPKEGSVAGGAWVTVNFEGGEDWPSSLLYPSDGSQLEMTLVNTEEPELARVPCDVLPIFTDLATVTCQIRSLPQEAPEGLYHLEVTSGGQVLSNWSEGPGDNSTFKFSRTQTPMVHQINPPSGVPGSVIQIRGWIITGKLETLDFGVEYIDSPLTLETELDTRVTLCSLIDRQTGLRYPVREAHGVGTLQCRVEGNYIGSQNVSFSVFNRGKSSVHKDAWRISAKQDLFLYQTHSEIRSVFPESGSLGGGTDITIAGDFFDRLAQVDVAGVPCHIRYVSPRTIKCTTGPVAEGTRLPGLHPGNRGLLFEVGDVPEGSDGTEAKPPDEWQVVPSASSPLGFGSAEGQRFRALLRGFFVAPETNNYTFWIQADNKASLYFSHSQDPRTKVKVASIPAGTADWFDSWERNGDEEAWQPKSQKLELTGGRRYYLEAVHHGMSPGQGMRIGVQIHNTWLTPKVVNTYLREKHQIRASAVQLPEIQMLTLSGPGDFRLSWGHAASQPVPANATAHQIQEAIEEMLAVKCELKPQHARVLLRFGFEQGVAHSGSDGTLTSGTEPFCGRFSVGQPQILLRLSPSSGTKYQLRQYPHLCFAYKGAMTNVLNISVTFTNIFLETVSKNLTCPWDLRQTRLDSWRFSCSNLWDSCVDPACSRFLPPRLTNTPVWVHQIDLLPPGPENGNPGPFFVDEVIVSDQNLTVSQADSRASLPGGNLIESLSVEGSPPTYKVSLWPASCGSDLPLIRPRFLPSEGRSEDQFSVNLSSQRLQRPSPPLGGVFQIQLPHTLISGVPVHISSADLRELLQNSADDFSAQYLKASDFTVIKDLSSCYRHVWTLTWMVKTGDLPNLIKVSAESLTGLSPAVTARLVYDGGVFLGPILGDMLATAHPLPQVVVGVNDIPAHCAGSCSFQYLGESTPRVSTVEYQLEDGFHLTAFITGSGFPAVRQDVQVSVSERNCAVTSANQSHVTCRMEALPVGEHRVQVRVKPTGLAIHARGGDAIYLSVKPRLSAVEPSSSSEIGGRWVTLGGTSLEGVSLILVGSQPCPIRNTTISSLSIQCRLPPRGDDGPTVNVTIISGNQSAVLPDAVTYSLSLNPIVLSLSRNGSNTAGDQTLFIRTSSLEEYTDLDVQVHVGGDPAWVREQVPEGFYVTLPPLPLGWHPISVTMNGIRIGSDGIDLQIQYLLEVFSIDPCCGSLLGGTTLTLSGLGFSEDPALISVSVSSQACDILQSTEDTIWCQVPPAFPMASLDSQTVPAPVEVRIGKQSIAHGAPSLAGQSNLTFWYQANLTPLVTALQGETVDGRLRLRVEGTHLSSSEAMLGDVTCDLELRVTNGTESLAECSLPLGSLEAGTYPFRVLQKQMGFANMSAGLQNFTVAPQITGVLPGQGSICGGTLLTVKGSAFRSRSKEVEVDLPGPYTCELRSLGDREISCLVLPGDGSSSVASQVLNVTVTVNGIASACLESCSLQLVEDATPTVDALTLRDDGRLTKLLIRGQRLARGSNELTVVVDDQLPCPVTFFNETGLVECQVIDISPGHHHLSVFNERNGRACMASGTSGFSITPRVLRFFPPSFGVWGGGLLTLQGAALQGQNTTMVLVGEEPCLPLDVGSGLIRCVLPAGNGSVPLKLEIDGVAYPTGAIDYEEASTPVLLFASPPEDLILSIGVAQISAVENMRILIGESPCLGVNGNWTVLRCLVPSLPAGEYQVRGHDLLRGWASSTLTYVSEVTVASISSNFGCLGGGMVHVRGAGFSPGNISAAVCGVPCTVSDNATTTDFSCQVRPLNASLAFLCSLRSLEMICEASSHPAVQCEVTIGPGTGKPLAAGSYIYLCKDGPACPITLGGRTHPAQWFSGLLISPKVERDEVLIYNSSCNITMETEAEMKCEGPNQPITAKITEIQKQPGQNTQGNFPLQFCHGWSWDHSWLPEGRPRDGDNVTVESGHSLLLDTNTSILASLHVKGGKLIFVGPGPIKLRAHHILVTDGGELRIGSPEEPFPGTAQIQLYGSSHSNTFFPYGAKFLAVRNGTLSLHGRVPRVSITYLRAAAQANDTKLALEEPVDWQPGDKAVVSGLGLEGSSQQDEIITIATVLDADLHLQSPLRYSHGFVEQRVAGRRLVLRATVALLSRNIVIRGNLTGERMAHLGLCAEAGLTIDASQPCLYERSERKLGSRDMGAVVIVQSFQGEPSRVHLQGVQFQHMGQAFQKHQSALTLAGPMGDSYIRDCSVWDSFNRGLSLLRTSGLRVDRNVFHNILGHGLLVGTHMEMRHLSWESVPWRENGDWSDQGNRIRSNAVIGVSGTEGLSNVEKFSPAGVYILSPVNVLEGNTVCSAGYGYFFHLLTNETSRAPLLSFSQNVAHSCTRFGLLVYPRYHPFQVNGSSPYLFQNFTTWGNQGGIQIFRSSNLQLQNFQVYSCKDFGIDTLESDENASVTDSLLLGHFTQKESFCMASGLQAPKRWDLVVSNTTFVNFDRNNCIAIRTCAGCYRGQGGFTVKVKQLRFANSPNRVAFPFPHAAMLEDLDGSLSGQVGNLVLPTVETLGSSCLVNISFSQAAQGSVCLGGVVFHRMSIGLDKAPDVMCDLTVTDSSHRNTTVNYVPDTLSNLYGWMALLKGQETYTLRFATPCVNRSLQYSATFDHFTSGDYLLVVHSDLPPFVDVLVTCGKRRGRPLQSLPTLSHDKGCDWFLNSPERRLTFLVAGEGQVHIKVQVKESLPPTTLAPSAAPEATLKWSLPQSWQGVKEGWGGYNDTLPSPGDDILILPNRTILVDVDLPCFKGFYVLGTLQFPVDRSNVLCAACIVILGGELKVGTFLSPLETGQGISILLRASEGVSCDRLAGVSTNPGTIGVYGKVELHSGYPRKSWTHLGTDIAPGNERIVVEDAVDWKPQGRIILSSSSYEAHEAELLTVKEVNDQHLQIHERLTYRHVAFSSHPLCLAPGSSHILEDGRSISLAAEVGLLTRNIQIRSDTPCTGTLTVGSVQLPSGEEFSGVLQLSNVEIQKFGSPQHPTIDFSIVSPGSWIHSSVIHQSCGGGIRATKSRGISLHDNIVFNTAGHGIDLEGDDHSLTRNLVVLTKQPAGCPDWVAGIKVNRANGTSLLRNAVAGSERIGFHIQGHKCSPTESLGADNVAHSNLHGFHLYKGDGFHDCTKISGFLSYKNFDYGVMFHLESAVEVENVTLIDNGVALLPVAYGSPARAPALRKQRIIVRSSVIVATSSSFDCIRDRIRPLSANATVRDRAPLNPQGGRVGVLWPGFTSGQNQRPRDPWHKVRNDPAIVGIMKLEEVTFCNFVKSCYSDDLDVCILPNPGSTGIMHPITAVKTQMLHVKDQSKFYFYSSPPREDLGSEDCLKWGCESPRKFLFEDLDGSALRLPPPVSVFPKSESEWTDSCFNTGTFREDRKCSFRPGMGSYVCKQTDYAILVLDKLEISEENKEPPSVVSVTESFVEAFSSVDVQNSCSEPGPTPAFYSILPTSHPTTVCFGGKTPPVMRLYLTGSERAARVVLSVFYDEPQSPRVFYQESFIPPSPVGSASFLTLGTVGSNYFSFQDNLLYIILEGDDPVEVCSGSSVYVAFTVAEVISQEIHVLVVQQQLADFLQVSCDHLRVVYSMPGDEDNLRGIADNVAKRKRHCPPVASCPGYQKRTSKRRSLEEKAVDWMWPSHFETATSSTVMIIEIGDPPAQGRTESSPSLSRPMLQGFTHQIITAQQTGMLQKALDMPVEALLVTQPTGTIGSGNASLNTGNLVYVQPHTLSVQTQPSNGEVGKELPVQPHLVILDKKGRRVEILGPPWEPWIVQASLEGAPEMMLQGCPRLEVQDGWVRFTNLAVLNSGSNWHLVFNVVFPPGANLTARSRPFVVLPVEEGHTSTIIMATILCSAASWIALCFLVFCWSKKSQTKKPKNGQIAELQSGGNMEHPHLQPRHPTRLQRPQERTRQDHGMIREDIEMKTTVGKLDQFCQPTVNGGSRRTSNRVVHERADKRKAGSPGMEDLAPGPGYGPVPPLHPLAPQGGGEVGDWRDARERSFGYDLEDVAQKDLLLLLHPNFSQDRMPLRGQRSAGKSDSEVSHHRDEICCHVNTKAVHHSSLPAGPIWEQL